MRRRSLCIAGVVAVAAVAGMARVATAEPTYSVRVLSDPEGATVYADSRQGEPLGETPLTTRMTAGHHTLILVLEDHEQAIEEVRVRKQRRRQTFKVSLVAIEYAVVEVVAEDDAPDTEGANILVDGEAVGTVPDSVKIGAGPHQVEITKDGYERFETWVELTAGEQTKITVALAPSDGAVGDGDDDDDDDGGGGGGGVTKPRPPRTRPLVVARAGLELGWRRWSYDNPQTNTARPFDASYVPVFRIAGEAYPLAARPGPIAGAGAFLSLGLGMPPDAQADSSTIDTSWSEFELGLRYRYVRKPGFGLEGAGELAYGRVAFGFAATGELADQTPDVDYRYVRLGVLGGYRSGKQLLQAGFDYLIVSSAGLVAERFRGASASGLGLRFGYAYRVRPKIDATAAFSYRRFGHDFDSEAGDLVVADGGLDRFYGLQIGAVYRY